MHRTFEELASQEIDRLYQGALFLKAGESQPAEDLLLKTLTSAFHAFRTVDEDTDAARWLEGRLVRAFLSAIPESDVEDARSAGAQIAATASMAVVEVDPFALYEAARAVPPRARAALWLVLLLRWKYSEASQLLETDLHELKGLLGYRHLLLTAVQRGSDERDGTSGDLM